MICTSFVLVWFYLQCWIVSSICWSWYMTCRLLVCRQPCWWMWDFVGIVYICYSKRYGKEYTKHKQTHPSTHTCMHTYACTHMCVHTCTRIHMLHTHTHTHTLIHMLHVHTYTHTHTQIHTFLLYSMLHTCTCNVTLLVYTYTLCYSKLILQTCIIKVSTWFVDSLWKSLTCIWYNIASDHTPASLGPTANLCTILLMSSWWVTKVGYISRKASV